LWPDLRYRRYCPGIYLEQLQKPEISVSKASIPADIQTISLLITTSQHYTWTKHGRKEDWQLQLQGLEAFKTTTTWRKGGRL
jgi:hypothetical protein